MSFAIAFSSQAGADSHQEIARHQGRGVARKSTRDSLSRRRGLSPCHISAKAWPSVQATPIRHTIFAWPRNESPHRSLRCPDRHDNRYRRRRAISCQPEPIGSEHAAGTGLRSVRHESDLAGFKSLPSRSRQDRRHLASSAFRKHRDRNRRRIPQRWPMVPVLIHMHRFSRPHESDRLQIHHRQSHSENQMGFLRTVALTSRPKRIAPRPHRVSAADLSRRQPR